MTSSESLPEDEAKPAPAQVVAAGHLHPGMLFLRFLDGLRQSLLPLLIAVLSQQPWLLVAVGMYFVLGMAYALARFVTFEYRLTTEELITTEGILHRQERRIPINRIQDVSFESTLVRRMCGLVVVAIETASSQGSEARLDSLSRTAAERLRNALYELRHLQPGASAADVPPPPQELLLLRSTPGDLFLLGLTDNRIGVILASLFGAYEVAYEFGLADRVGGVFGAFAAWLSEVHWALLVGVLAAVFFVILLGGWLASIGASFLMFWNFHLTLRDDVLTRRYGLFTTRAASLPRRRVQRVTVEQSFLRRLFGLAVLRADSAGSGMDPGQEARGGRDVVVPLSDRQRIEPLVPVLLPGVELWRLRFRRVSRKVVLRITAKGGLFAAILAGMLWPAVHAYALLVLLLVPVAWGIGVLSFHNLGYTEPDGHLALRWGILGRYRALVPLRKVQGLVTRATPVDRLLGLRSLTVYVAGGSPTHLPNLPRDEAMALRTRLAKGAAAARFEW